jgi:hypothetical protein
MTITPPERLAVLVPTLASPNDGSRNSRNAWLS